MFFTLKEVVNCLGISLFEIWLNVVSLAVFAISLPFLLENSPLIDQNWWRIFLPLFVADGLNCYFCFIVFIRYFLSGQIKNGVLTSLWSLTVLTLSFIFKVFLCQKLSGTSTLEYSEIVSPIFVLLQLFAARACHMH